VHEDALIGAQLRVTNIYGSFDPSGHYVSPRGARELDFEEDIAGAVRVLSRGQIAALVPLVETYRRVPTAHQFGGGIGDIGLSARYDFTLSGASLTIPGIAALASITFPTGRRPESASPPLAADATGIGSFEGWLGLALEQTFGHALVNLTGQAGVRSARTIDDHREQDGPGFIVSTAAGAFTDGGSVLAFSASYTAHLRTTLDGEPVADSAHSFVRLGLLGGYALTDVWRMQGGLFFDPPIPHFGRNQPLGVGLSWMIVRAWI
jgi:hypothetical protein